MSRVLLIAADKPLPLWMFDQQIRRTTEDIPNPVLCGFSVFENRYYRQAVDDLGYPMKPYQYELYMYSDEADFSDLREYLREHFVPGETVELWNVWVGDVNPPKPPHFSGMFEDFDLDTLKQLFEQETCWLSITI